MTRNMIKNTPYPNYCKNGLYIYIYIYIYVYIYIYICTHTHMVVKFAELFLNVFIWECVCVRLSKYILIQWGVLV